jgi:hypothetical protein
LAIGGNYAGDSPDVQLQPYYSKIGRTFGATMYMLWTSDIPSSIPVPISSQNWQIKKGSSTNSSYPTNQSWTTPAWQSPLGSNADPINYVDTQPSQSPYGYPTWSNLATPVATPNCPTANTGEFEVRLGEEQ